jgi:hypothetical protein
MICHRTLPTLALALAACGPHVPTDREFCEQRERAFERAYPEDNPSDHAMRVDMCVRGIADEHGREVDPEGRDSFQRRLICAKHLGKNAALEAWQAMKNCESATLSYPR